MDDDMLAQAAHMIGRGEDIEGLLTGCWSPGASALRSLAAEVRELIVAADEVETMIHDAHVESLSVKADEALDGCRWSCRSADCEAPAAGLSLDGALRRCPGCGGALLRTVGAA